MPSHPLRAERSSSRDRLLAAAKRLFAGQGYEQSATSAIARQAGTSESQLMRYFGGKVGLLDALFDAAWTHINARVARVVQATDDSREALLRAIQVVVTVLARDHDLATLLMFEGRRMRGSEPRIKLSRGFLHFTDNVRGLVRKAQAGGDLDPAFDANAVTSALLGATESMIRDRLLASGTTKRGFREREIRRTLEGMLAGFASADDQRHRRRAPRRRASPRVSARAVR